MPARRAQCVHCLIERTLELDYDWGMLALKRSAGVPCVLAVIMALVSNTLSARTLDVEYARPGESPVPHDGKALVFTRISFIYDGKAIFPWQYSMRDDVADAVLGIRTHEYRHVWLRRLETNEKSAELRPDKDGFLAIWLPPGDYALLGSEDAPTEGGIQGVIAVALLRVPADQPVVYAGELVYQDEFKEGWHAHYMFGSGSVVTDSLATAIQDFETRHGALPGSPAVSAWCVGRHVPSASLNSKFTSRSRQLLDQGCSPSP